MSRETGFLRRRYGSIAALSCFLLVAMGCSLRGEDPVRTLAKSLAMAAAGCAVGWALGARIERSAAEAAAGPEEGGGDDLAG